MKLNLLTSVFSLSVILLGCSGTPDSVSRVHIEIIKIDSWFNLMPGGDPSYHIAGEVLVSNDSDTMVDSLLLDKIIIIQNKKKVYEIKPFFQPAAQEVEHSIYSGEKKAFMFGTKPGLKIDPVLNADKYITAELHFIGNEINIIHVIDSLEIQKVY